MGRADSKSFPDWRKMSGAAGMVFCKECNNMLYPREDKQAQQLIYVCRQCEFREDTEDWCIYRNQLSATAQGGRPAGTMNQDLISDPTLPRTREITCDACSHNEAVFFHSSVRGPNEGMTLWFVCVQCHHRWKN